MRAYTFLLLTLLSSLSMAAPDHREELVNKISKYESQLRKYKGELYIRSKQVKNSTDIITQLNNDHSQLLSKYRQLANDTQFLKYQNDQLVKALKNGQNYTPELALKLKDNSKAKGRLPASVPTN